MGKKVVLTVLCFLLLFPAILFGQVPENIKSAYETIDKNDLEALLTFVASDYTEGRETTSRGYDIAAQYTASIYKFIGLKPGGDTKMKLRNFDISEFRDFHCGLADYSSRHHLPFGINCHAG